MSEHEIDPFEDDGSENVWWTCHECSGLGHDLEGMPCEECVGEGGWFE